MNSHPHFMALALEKARQALDAGEFPVGCIIAGKEGVLACGRRRSSSGKAPGEIDHAEINALRNLETREQESGALDRSELTVYVTLEPCLMCFGAILISGIRRIVYGLEDIMGGGTGCRRDALPPLYRDPKIRITPGVMRQESLHLLQAFFREPKNTYLKDSLLAQAILNA